MISTELPTATDAAPGLRVRDFYAGKTVLLTGATGLLGAVLLEKFLRDVSGVRRVYVMIRPGRDRAGAPIPVARRLRNVLSHDSLFSRLRQLHGPAGFSELIRDRVVAVEGDLDLPDLGLPAALRSQLESEVDVIINAAANVTFDAPVDAALRSNTLGPAHLLGLARRGHKRPLLAHVSTAYVSGQREGKIAEGALVSQLVPQGTGYDVDAEVLQVQELIARSRRTFSDAKAGRAWLVKLGARRAARWGWNDVYSYTKAMGEQLLVRQSGDHPLLILRPSIVESAHNQPEPGWLDRMRMADPLVIAYGRYQLPDFPGHGDEPFDLVPVDLVVNALLAAVAAYRSTTDVPVYQVVTSATNPITLREFVRYVREAFEKESLTGRHTTRPLPHFTFPALTRYRARLRYLEMWPANLRIVLGTLFSGTAWGERLAVRGLTRRSALRRRRYYADLFGPYTMLRARFQSDNTQSLWRDLAADERSDFNFDLDAIDWRHYIRDLHVPGLKRYVLGVEARRNGKSAGNGKKPAADAFPAPRNGHAPGLWQDPGVLARAAHAATRWSFSRILHLHVGMQVDGMAQLADSGPYIIVSNHNSHMDAAALLVLFGNLGRPVHPVAARDYFFDTVLRAWISRTCLSAVPFERNAPTYGSLGLSVELLRRGHSLIFFPEGGRSPDGRMRPFKRGVGLVALEANVPIVPVHISGSFEAMPKGVRFPRRGPVTVRVGRPIPTDAYGYGNGADTDAARRLTDDVRRAIEQLG